jgi:predicted MFS family arabinose efflux permease
MKQAHPVAAVPIAAESTYPRYPVVTALALSLAAAIALGLSRFSYGLLLPSMRTDLDWSYLLAGSMNTCNAVGYLIGALSTPMLMRRFGVWPLLIAGSVLAGLFMMISGLVTDSTALFLQRVCAGVASAFVFIAGGVLSAKLGSMHRERAGLLIGLYYGGTGIGIALSAVLVPATLVFAQEHHVAHAWQWPWLALGLACLISTAVMAGPAKEIGAAAVPQQASRQRFSVKDFRFGLSGYFMFGMGYIGYMTFVVALLKQQGMRSDLINLFYMLLGLAVVASSRIWARMLDKFKGGESLAILNGLLCVAAILPALTSLTPVVFLSGIVFGGVFLSVVASTTALVRHNLPQEAWTAGISAFTTVFALGQIVGPAMVGWIADTTGGLERGLVASSISLLIGAVLASRQKALISR